VICGRMGERNPPYSRPINSIQERTTGRQQLKTRGTMMKIMTSSLDFDRCMGKLRREYDYCGLRASTTKNQEAKEWWAARAEKLMKLIQVFAKVRDEE
jgi:hypothetical protein